MSDEKTREENEKEGEDEAEVIPFPRERVVRKSPGFLSEEQREGLSEIVRIVAGLLRRP